MKDGEPAVNRQPGFRGGTRRADSTKEAREQTHAHTHHRTIETQTCKTSQCANRRKATHVNNNPRNVTGQPTNQATKQPSHQATKQANKQPSNQPTNQPANDQTTTNAQKASTENVCPSSWPCFVLLIKQGINPLLYAFSYRLSVAAVGIN